LDHEQDKYDWRGRVYALHRDVNDAAPVSVATFSNVHAAVEWAAARARTGIDETLNYGDDDFENE
jgi:hypothetical protein